jgi:DNA-directed RNA polymerase subunit RPC12/RpoP
MVFWLSTTEWIMFWTPKYICPNCGTVGYPVVQRTGIGFVTLILVVVLIVPAIIYELSRKKYTVCKQCGARDLIPVKTPRGKILLEQMKAK